MSGSIMTEYALAARRALETANAQRYNEEVLRARRDPNFYCEWCFRDDQHDKPLKQAWHHRQWQEHVWKHDRLVMWFPIEHGKTTQAKMTLCRLLGEHGNRQYAYISSKDKQARKVLGSVKREIETNDRLHLLYPELVPQQSAISKAREEWGNTSIRVQQCPPGSKDASLAAFGIDGQILGSRLHGAILDNVLDAKNTRSKAQREWVLDIIQDEIIGRVMEGGFIWVLDTSWYEDDALHMLAKKPRWFSIRFDAEQGEHEGETLWPDRWPRARLDATRAELGPTAYDRQFRNKPLSESMAFFKQAYWDSSYGRCMWIEDWDQVTAAGIDLQLDLRTGIDLATRKGETHDVTAYATVIAQGHRRQLINMHAEKQTGNEIMRTIIGIYRRLHAPVSAAGGNAVFVVEDNAAQVYIVQMLQDPAVLYALGLTADEAADIKVVGRTATSTKRDAELGIQGIASAIESDKWDFAPHHEVRMLREEMRVWNPEAHTGDRLMALWHASSHLFQSAGGFHVDFID